MKFFFAAFALLAALHNIALVQAWHRQYNRMFLGL
jgi:hypothetical protein